MKQNEEIMRIVQEAELEAAYEQAASSTPDLETNLLRMKRNYEDMDMSYRKKCDGTAQSLVMRIMATESLQDIHSVRYRVKSFESLLKKYIKKKAVLPENPGINYEIEKYRPMTGDNYHKIITDLIGIRILIRYQKQWETVHKWIWEHFHSDDRPYIGNWLDEYPGGDNNDFLVEQPKLYLRDENDRSFYQTFGKDVFDVHISREGYSSIHYVIWYDGKYVEIQVRTIYDEAWGECTHDLVYKSKNKAKRAELGRFSYCLAAQTKAAGMIADFMYEKVNSEFIDWPGQEPPDNENAITKEEDSKVFSEICQRINNINKIDTSFDGNIDGLL